MKLRRGALSLHTDAETFVFQSKPKVFVTITFNMN